MSASTYEFLLPSTLILLGLGFLVSGWSWKIRPALSWGLAYLLWAACELLLISGHARYSDLQLSLAQTAFLLSIFFQMHGLQDQAGEPGFAIRARLALCAVTIGLTVWLIMSPDKQWAVFALRLAMRLILTGIALAVMWRNMEHAIDRILFAVVVTMTLAITVIAAEWIQSALTGYDRSENALLLSVAQISGNVLAIVFALAALLAVILKVMERYKEEALTDPLSGLANKRRFDAFSQTEWQRAIHMRRPLSLLMIDVDMFKTFNDTYGHAAGDRCLVRVAGIIASCARRPNSLCARFGGEEFAVILPDTPSSGATTAANLICDAVRAAAIPHQGSPFGIVTVSIGGITMLPSGLSNERLVDTADANLYKAKAKGRNCVEVS